LRDGESRPVRWISVLSPEPVRDRDGDPAEGGTPADHRNGDRNKKTIDETLCVNVAELIASASLGVMLVWLFIVTLLRYSDIRIVKQAA
jgi:hypothetical protein